MAKSTPKTVCFATISDFNSWFLCPKPSLFGKFRIRAFEVLRRCNVHRCENAKVNSKANTEVVDVSEQKTERLEKSRNRVIKLSMNQTNKQARLKSITLL